MECNVFKTDFSLAKYKVAYTNFSLSLKPTTVAYAAALP